MQGDERLVDDLQHLSRRHEFRQDDGTRNESSAGGQETLQDRADDQHRFTDSDTDDARNLRQQLGRLREILQGHPLGYSTSSLSGG